MDRFEFACPHCHKRFKAPERYRGRRIKCPVCQSPIALPAEANPMRFSEPGDSRLRAPPTEAEPQVMRPCPYCDRATPRGASTCRHCGKSLDYNSRVARPVMSTAYTLEQVIGIARAQRGVLLCVAANIALIAAVVTLMVKGGAFSAPSPYASAPPTYAVAGIWILQILGLILTVFEIYYIYKLAGGLEVGHPVLWALAMFIPVISLLLLLSLVTVATSVIRRAGYSVGLIGARVAEIEAAI